MYLRRTFAFVLVVGLSGCSPAAPSSTPVSPMVIAGSYTALLTGDLPAGCPLARLEATFRQPAPLAQNGSEVAFLAQNSSILTLELHGTLAGSDLTYRLAHEYHTPFGTTRVSAHGTAKVGTSTIAGSGAGDVAVTSMNSRFEAVTESCHADNLLVTLTRAATP